MKKSFSGFVSGVICTLLVCGVMGTALAASGRMTIEVDPINIQVNGETFAPKDVNGNPVPVFAYNGTTMAPLRALAEAYGLEVGYDAATNMATVIDPEVKPTTPAPDTTAQVNDYSDWSAEDEAAYQEFKGLWEIKPRYDTQEDTFKMYIAWYVGEKDIAELKDQLSQYGETTLDCFTFRLMNEMLAGENGNLALRHPQSPSLFGTQKTDSGQTKVADQIFHSGLL